MFDDLRATDVFHTHTQNNIVFNCNAILLYSIDIKGVKADYTRYDLSHATEVDLSQDFEHRFKKSRQVACRTRLVVESFTRYE